MFLFQILMYVGILLFLVSVVLLVMLCSSWGGGTQSSKDPNKKCTFKFLFCKKQQFIPTVAQAPEQFQQVDLFTPELEPRPISPVKEVEVPEKKVCKIKNCVCMQQQRPLPPPPEETVIPIRTELPPPRDLRPISMYEAPSPNGSPFVVPVKSPPRHAKVEKKAKLASVHQKPPKLPPRQKKPPPAPKIPDTYQVIQQPYRHHEAQIYTEPQVSYTSLPHRTAKIPEAIIDYHASLPHKLPKQPSTPTEYKSTASYKQQIARPAPISYPDQRPSYVITQPPLEYRTTTSEQGVRILHTPSDYQMVFPYTSYIPEPVMISAPPVPPHKPTPKPPKSHHRTPSSKSQDKERPSQKPSTKHKTSSKREDQKLKRPRPALAERPQSMPIPPSPSLPLQATRPLPVQIKPAQSLPLTDEYFQSIGQFNGDK